MTAKHLRLRGFTLVELIIAIAIIGILATLVIVGGNGYFKSVAKAATKVSLETAAAKLSDYKSTNGQFEDTALNPPNFKQDPDVKLTTLELTPTTYCLKAESKKYNDIVYYVNHKGAVTTTDCSPASPPGGGGSPACTSPYTGSEYVLISDSVGTVGVVGTDPLQIIPNPNTYAMLCTSASTQVNLSVKCDIASKTSSPNFFDLYNQTTDLTGNGYVGSIGSVTTDTNGLANSSPIVSSPSWGPPNKSTHLLVCQVFAHKQPGGARVPSGGLTNNNNSNARFSVQYNN